MQPQHPGEAASVTRVEIFLPEPVVRSFIEYCG